MFPDFTKMQADAANAMKRAEERHVEMMAAQKAIIAELQTIVKISDISAKYLARISAARESPPVAPAAPVTPA